MIREIDKPFFEKDWAAISMYEGYRCQRCGGEKFHNWITPEDTFHVSCNKCHKAPEMMPNSFVKWWKKHRHSGYCEDHEGKAHWGSEPNEAWHCDKYRTEFSIDTGYFYKPRHEYSAKEIEDWAKEQKEMEEYVDGDYSLVPIPVFEATLSEFLTRMRRAFKRRSDEAKGEDPA